MPATPLASDSQHVDEVVGRDKPALAAIHAAHRQRDVVEKDAVFVDCLSGNQRDVEIVSIREARRECPCPPAARR